MDAPSPKESVLRRAALRAAATSLLAGALFFLASLLVHIRDFERCFFFLVTLGIIAAIAEAIEGRASRAGATAAVAVVATVGVLLAVPNTWYFFTLIDRRSFEAAANAARESMDYMRRDIAGMLVFVVLVAPPFPVWSAARSARRALRLGLPMAPLVFFCATVGLAEDTDIRQFAGCGIALAVAVPVASWLAEALDTRFAARILRA